MKQRLCDWEGNRGLALQLSTCKLTSQDRHQLRKLTLKINEKLSHIGLSGMCVCMVPLF